MTLVSFGSDVTADGAIPPSNSVVICVKVFLREHIMLL